ncbi:MAG: DUF2177 family protein [Gemmatimonadales bacterium]|nr:DUF2177 family protein [Gemmatimonadales bacterium]
MPFLKLYGAGLVVLLGMDLLWLGVVAKGFYQRQLGHLMRPDVQWGAAVAFYLIYVAVVVLIVVMPAIEKRSLSRAVLFGALFGLAAYAAYDLTSLALIRDFPATVAIVDLLWGTTLTAVLSGAVYYVGASAD